MADAVRSTQAYLETVSTGSEEAAVRASQAYAEVLGAGGNQADAVRASQTYVEVLESMIQKPPFPPGSRTVMIFTT